VRDCDSERLGQGVGLMSLSLDEMRFMSLLQKICEEGQIGISFANIGSVASGLYITRIGMDNDLDPNQLNITIEMTVVCPGDLVAQATDINFKKELRP
jgi:hypothetical protein